jgi:molybdopterin-guanine dinucleotide biosynthesis protein A
MTPFPLVDLTAIILAGGKSLRMGQDKALLTLKGRSLLTQTCQVAQKVAQTVYVITPWADRYQAFVPENCRILPEVWPPDCQKSAGPLWGFSQALSQVQTSWILLLACDLPYLNAIDLQKYAQVLPEIALTKIAVLPRSVKGWEPLCGFYRTSCLGKLTFFLDQFGYSFQQWLSQESVEELKISNQDLLFNCNTPKDWAAIQRALEKDQA